MQLLVFSCLLAAAAAHICMMSPPQRGSMAGFNKPEAANCFLTKGPCGGRMKGNVIGLLHGKNFTVTFQKNLDHYNSAMPGYFKISIGKFDQGSAGRELMRFPDMGKPSLTVFDKNVTIPIDVIGPGYQIQVLYAANHAGVPAGFYQCGDVTIF